MKDKIIELLEKNAKEGWSGDVEAVGYVDFESVAEQLVKLFTIHDVVWRSEQLVCEHPFNRRVKSDPWTVICGKCKTVI